MNCRESKRLMQKVIAGDASAAEWESVRGHVASCARCADEWRALSAASHALREAGPQPAPGGRDLAGAVMARIAREARRPAAGRSRLGELLASRPMQAAGAIAATAICALILWLATPGPQALALLMGGGPRNGY